MTRPKLVSCFTLLLLFLVSGRIFSKPSEERQGDAEMFSVNNKRNGVEKTAMERTNSRDLSILRSTTGMSGYSGFIGSQGKSFYISQSIGQNGVIGTFAGSLYSIRQGFQQPPGTVKIFNDNLQNFLKVSIYPIPFHSAISVVFENVIDEEIRISITDISGRTVFVKSYAPVQVLSIPLDNLNYGVYLITVISDEKQYKANIIKH